MTGIIDVGGGVRGIYGAGVFDYLMEQGISFDECIGISAGAANISAYLAHQIGRNYRFYTEYMFRKEYMGWEHFLHTKSYINLDYIYSTLSNSDGEDPLDYETLAASPSIFKIIAADAETGKPVYFEKNRDLKKDQYAVIKASCCVPVVDQPYPVGDRKYYDGGIADPIPVEKAFADGCDRVVVVLTRPKDYFRDGRKDRRMARLIRHTYPVASRAVAGRSRLYNTQLALARKYEEEGKVLIVAPDDISGISTLTRNLAIIRGLYTKGHRDAAAIPAFLRS